MSKSKIRDNHNHGKFGDFLIDNLKQGCKIDVVSAYFTIYAYYNLKEQLDEIESMRFLFGEPTFIKEFIYYKTLFHVFGQFLDSQSDRDFKASQNLLDSQIWASLYEFQKIGVTGALNRIRRNGGCIIADSVGLGKTYEALAIIKEFEFRNKNVLVLCPKKLSSNWTVFQASQNHALNPFPKDKFQYHVLYHKPINIFAATNFVSRSKVGLHE